MSPNPKAPYLARAAVGADPVGDPIEVLAFARKEAAYVEALSTLILGTAQARARHDVTRRHQCSSLIQHYTSLETPAARLSL